MAVGTLNATTAAAPIQSAPQTAQSKPSVTQFVSQKADNVLGPTGGTGALGINDPNVAVARRDAAAHQNDRVDWRNPQTTLNHMSQIDSDQGQNAGGNDPVRCGAANLVAGTVLLGPQQTRQAMQNVQQRGQKLREHYVQLRNEFPRNSPEYAQLTQMMNHLDQGINTMRDLRQIPSDKLSVKDLQRMQEGVYEVAVLDQRMNGQNQYSESRFSDNPADADHGYLTTGALQTYRDLMWGNQRPQVDGQPQNIYWVNNEANGGHFVLANQNANADGSRGVGYNPWPDADGTAYVRSQDGAGARVVARDGQAVPGVQLRGMSIDEDGRRLPNR